MKYLLDSNVVSELMKETPDSRMVDWLNANDDEAMLCAVVLSEIAAGIESLPEGKRKATLLREIRFIQEDYRERILPFDESVAREWARYSRELREAGCTPPLLDSQVAAIARAWGLKVATRNTADFPLVEMENPFNLQS